MERIGLGQATASVWLVLLAFILLWLAGVTIWAHVRGTKILEIANAAERRAAGIPWARRVSLTYAGGWTVFAYATLSLGLFEQGMGFVSDRLLLVAVWLVSPGGIYALAYAYWMFWVRVGMGSERPVA